MFDELERLRKDELLRRLLEHYADGNREDRETWQDRLMTLDGSRPEELVKLHGLLLAFDWIEQNTGITPRGKAGSVPLCYRLTAGGRRALKQLGALPEDESLAA